jgi:hypothetical protein
MGCNAFRRGSEGIEELSVHVDRIAISQQAKYDNQVRSRRSSKPSNRGGKGSAAWVSPRSPMILHAMSADSRRRAVPRCVQMRLYWISSFPVQPHSGSDTLGIAVTLAVCQVSVCSQTSRELAGTRSCMSSCLKRNGWGQARWNGRNEGFVCGGRRGSTPADMTEMPEARLGWALEDTQLVSIMLSSPNLSGPFSGWPGPFWKAAPHPAGSTWRGERRPAGEVVKKLLFTGSAARDDRRRVACQRLLNNMVGERHSRLRDRNRTL